MTPEERELVADLFDRLAELERERRDPDAERVIREGLARAPNAVYALVQTVLLQDEGLKAADERIAELEDALAQAEGTKAQPRSFLGDRRDSNKWNTGDVIRGSVPNVRPGDQPMGAPSGYGDQRGGPYSEGSMPMQGSGGPMGGGPGGGGFLGTAAAVAAGAIGGGLLMNGIRSAMGGQGKGPFSGAFDQLSGGKSGGSESAGSLGKEAGLDDIGASRRVGAADLGKEDSSSGLEELEGSFEEEDDVSLDDDTE